MEIEIDFLGRSRPAVKQEGLCERVGWRARGRSAVRRRRRGRRNQSRAGIVKTRFSVRTDVLVSIGQLREVGRGLAVPRGKGGEVGSEVGDDIGTGRNGGQRNTGEWFS